MWLDEIEKEPLVGRYQSMCVFFQTDILFLNVSVVHKYGVHMAGARTVPANISIFLVGKTWRCQSVPWEKVKSDGLLLVAHHHGHHALHKTSCTYSSDTAMLCSHLKN